MKKILFLFFAVIVTSNVTFCQIDLSKSYSPLRAQGKIPEVFTMPTASKVNDGLSTQRNELTKKQQEAFLKTIHYGIDEILHSGMVLYGDPTTQYVEKVGRNLLKGNKDLRNKIQFYVLKSNVTNALSTDQGIVFVTLGLLSQLENEAQLACVLAHEIAHYEEAHVRKSFSESLNDHHDDVSYDERITRMSNHSKEREFEADKEGIKLYHKAGYDKNELLSAFDVLMYSYLPFDEEPLPKDYLSNDLVFIPSQYYPEEINPILIEEDYDDSKSSHPNIRRRKDAVFDELDKFSNWGKKVNIIGENEFINVRNLARFESLRIDLFNHQFGNVLYNVFLLEKEFPENDFLARSKAQAWLGLATFTIAGRKSKTIQKPKKVEGESHAMHYVLSELSKEQLLVVAMRKIQDANNQFPDDPELKEIKNRMIGNLAKYSRFNLTDYQPVNYQTAIEEFEASKNDLSAPDTTNVESDDNQEELSKYEKIKIKREGKVAISAEDEFDEEKFHLFALSDLVQDEEFKRQYRTWKDKLEEEEEEENKWTNLSKKERKTQERINREKAYSDLVLLEPSFTYWESKTTSQEEEGEELEKRVILALKNMGKQLGVSINDMSNENVQERDTYGYNERAMLMDYLRQVADYDDVKMFPVDYSYLNDLQANYGDGKLMFVYGDHVNNSKISIGMGIVGVLFPPVGIPYFARKIFSGHRVELGAVYIDLTMGKVTKSKSYSFNQKPTDRVLEGFVYDMLSH